VLFRSLLLHCVKQALITVAAIDGRSQKNM